jgi:hypothetical protein
MDPACRMLVFQQRVGTMARLFPVFLVAMVVVVGSARPDDTREDFFELKVRPVLTAECLPCHAGEKAKSGLKLDTREALLLGGDRGPAAVAGDAGHSLLVDAIRQGGDLKMPPKKRLPGEVVDAFVKWIKDGAVWPKGAVKSGGSPGNPPPRHWAFEPIRQFDPPADPDGWSAGPIDRFVARRRKSAGLRPVASADKRTLLRRTTFDLIGLPPTPDEIDDFLRDESPAAFARVVDRLLASPQYGERWGRHWMDVVHYADTAGDNADYPIPEVAKYRDYIIDSFNRDKPFDQFVREQIAGDILANRGEATNYADAVVATGFLALSRRYATAPFELWHLTLEDTIDTTGRAFLGLTLRCARCHDHKYDPVTQRDYYALYGIFASTTFPYAGSEEFHSKKFPRSGFVPLLEAKDAGPKLRAYHAHLANLEKEIQALESAKDPTARGRLGTVTSELARLKNLALPADVPGSYAVTEGKPVDVAIQLRGEPSRPGAVVPHGVPQFAFLAAEPPEKTIADASGRLELARWLTQCRHPLVARVIVNRIWQHHFGRGIVATPSNFGTRGEPPTHPELLDWLAGRFVAQGWSVKAIQREIVLSKTYQLGGDFDASCAAIDPENRWLWRFSRQRLDAESIRDAMLAVSGRLDLCKPAPHPFPPIDDWHWTQHSPFKVVYATNQRTVYLMTQRLARHPYLAIFDGPDTNTSTDVRTRSTVPLQALYLMNNPFVAEQAAALAKRLLELDGDEGERIARSYDLAWGRLPEPCERDRAVEFIRTCKISLGSTSLAPPEREREAWTSLAKVLLTSNEFLYID